MAMYLSLFVTLALLSVAFATAPILVSECGTLRVPFSTYQLARDIAVQDTTYGYVCFDIKGDGITLDGNGYELYSASKKMLHATGVQYSGTGDVVKNMRISNIRTGIFAKGKFGEVSNNTITKAVNGIDVSATNNRITGNIIGQFEAYESTAGIYVFFAPLVPVDAYINITNNVISDIQGDSFALGISVYYATSVSVANNFIFNLQGGISAQAISVMHGQIDELDNSFSPPADVEGSQTQVITILVSLFALVASYVFFRASSPAIPSSSPSLPLPVPLVYEKEDKSEAQKEKEEKERDREEFEKDGADVVKRISFSIGTSPLVR